MSLLRSALLCITFCMLVLALSAGAALSQANMTHVQEEAFPRDQRPPAVFEHDAHNSQAGVYDCSVCHHVYEDGEKVQGAMSVNKECSDCHGVESTQDNSMPLMKAYHEQCISCHQEEDAGPLACGECHVKD